MTSSEGSPARTPKPRRGNDEGTLPKLMPGGRRWQIQITLTDVYGETKRRSVYGGSPAEARANVKLLRKKLAEGAPAVDSKLTLAEYAQTWLDTTLQARDISDGSKDTYAGAVRKHIIASKLGRKKVVDIVGQHVDAWKVDMRKAGVGIAVRTRSFLVLDMIFATAKRDHLIGINPVDGIEPPKNVTRVVREAKHMTSDELCAVLSATSRTSYAHVFTALSETGLRIGELLALTWACVDEEARLLYVVGTLHEAREGGAPAIGQTKSMTSTREVPISRVAAQVLREIRQEQRVARLAAGSKYVDSDHVFTNKLGGTLSQQSTLRALHKALDDAALPQVTLHTFRHTFATGMLNAGVDLKHLSEILGHASIAITAALYIHVTKDSKRAAIDKWDERKQA